jgi:hypothetical protein
MSGFDYGYRQYEHQYLRTGRVSGAWITMAAVTFAVVVSVGFILAYSYTTSYEVTESATIQSPPAPHWTADPTPTPASDAAPKS